MAWVKTIYMQVTRDSHVYFQEKYKTKDKENKPLVIQYTNTYIQKQMVGKNTQKATIVYNRAKIYSIFGKHRR